MNALLDAAKSYYDAHVARKLRDFVEGNDRVERAWLTIEEWAPRNPIRVLEIGCGIGDICWRITRRWVEAEVVGVDISPTSLEIARKLFESRRLSFVEGPLFRGVLPGNFDLVVLMDVYEHIAVKDRPGLHEALADLLSDRSRIILSFPTPWHQAWLRQFQPDQIQPVDEDIDVSTIVLLARDTKTELLLYREVGIWHEGDYAHAVIGKRDGWVSIARILPDNQGIRKRIARLLVRGANLLVPPRSQRLALVHQQLGVEHYPG